MKKTTVLCVLDGVGENPDPVGNAVAQANTPNLDRFYKTYPHSQLLTHGEAVGLPEGQMGGSDMGHFNLGAGRIIYHVLQKGRRELASGDFMKKEDVKPFLDKVRENQKPVHLIGLVSAGGVHSHIDHLIGLIQNLAPLGLPVYIHVITDGRDTHAQAAKEEIAPLVEAIKEFDNVKIADVVGRFYPMDRDNNMERIQAALDMYIHGKALHKADDAYKAIGAAYERDETDEFITSTSLPPLNEGGTMGKDDALLFFNFRADRERQIVGRFIEEGYTNIATMVEYDEDFRKDVTVFYPPEKIKNTIGEYLSNLDKTQFRIAETEKYAYVTFCFNGGREDPFPGEDRKIVPSPKVHTFDLQPEMSIAEVGEELFAAIRSGKYDMIICNIANGDIVGHTGNFAAAIKAMEAVDGFVGELEKVILETDSHLLLTADHGNCEKMLDEDGEVVTSHSMFPVPLFYMGPEKLSLKNGRLCDVAPTMLGLMGLSVPDEMTGENLAEAAG